MKEPPPCGRREIRGYVACLAQRKMVKEGLSFGPAMREAWREVKNKCPVKS